MKKIFVVTENFKVTHSDLSRFKLVNKQKYKYKAQVEINQYYDVPIIDAIVSCEF